MIPGDGRPKDLHHIIFNLFEHVEVMEDNSGWLKVADPDDLPSQAEDKEGRFFQLPVIEGMYNVPEASMDYGQC